MRTHSQMLCTAAVHIGIIGGTITYVCIGAALFLHLERPIEITSRQYHLANYAKIKYKFVQAIVADNLTENDLNVLSINYIEELFDFYKDSQPPVPVPYLILYIIIGVILVTITVEVLAAEAINHIHYMGRHVGKARKITRKFYKIARSVNVRRGFNIGLMQIESFIHLSLIFGIMKADLNGKGKVYTSYNINIPVISPNDNVESDDIEFVDEDESERFGHVL
ncbi:Ion channel [Dirofilaria immitis]|nr:Ion channel [Dirofilaria immitis]